MIFDPAHLTVAVGVVVSVFCIPVALQVLAAEPEEVEIEVFEPDPSGQKSDVPADIPWEAAE